MPSKVSHAKRGWRNCSHPFLRLSSTTTRLKTTTADRDVTWRLRQTRSTLQTTLYVVPQTSSNVVWRPTDVRETLWKRRHMTPHRQTRSTLQNDITWRPTDKRETLCKRRHITSYRQTRSTLQNDIIWRPTDKRETLQKTSYVVSQTNDKHFAKDVIWRPTDKRETLCKRRHMTSHRQKRNTLQTTSCDVIRAGKSSSGSGLGSRLTRVRNRIMQWRKAGFKR